MSSRRESSQQTNNRIIAELFVGEQNIFVISLKNGGVLCLKLLYSKAHALQ